MLCLAQPPANISHVYLFYVPLKEQISFHFIYNCHIMTYVLLVCYTHSCNLKHVCFVRLNYLNCEGKVKREVNRRIGAASAAMLTLHWPIEVSWFTKKSFQFTDNSSQSKHHSKHHIWSCTLGSTKKIRSSIKANMTVQHGVVGLDPVLEIGYKVQAAYRCSIEVVWASVLSVFHWRLACPTGRSPRVDPEHTREITYLIWLGKGSHYMS